jgi:2-dehydro-3-deoxyglucarate aldolase/4-hydroxy-2-oxoheptanedioate aldolase
MRDNPVRAAILAGEPVAGAMVFEFFTPGIATVLSGAGCRFAIHDMEHTGLGFETLKWLCATHRGLPIEPMVRVPRGEYTYVARALDCGATGIMVPMVESAEQARRVVEAAWYPPYGRRGAAFGFAHDDYEGGDVADKIRRLRERTLLIAQVETERGLAQVDAIAAVEGIDVLFVGHFDLSNFLGIPGAFDDPRFEAALRRVAESARAHGKAAGFMAGDARWIDRVRALGFSMIAVGTDFGLMAAGVRQLTARVTPAGR